MQRIDEITYIDDTLVTCTEYQLFIDEMREQGKYYQPDHWKSYQFPAGHAREPILGVRQSDAVVFCEWLSNREDEGWRYRLPTQPEGKDFLLKPIDQKPLGYWSTIRNDTSEFIWVSYTSLYSSSSIVFDELIRIGVYKYLRINTRYFNQSVDRAVQHAHAHGINAKDPLDFVLNRISKKIDFNLNIELSDLKDYLDNRYFDTINPYANFEFDGIFWLIASKLKHFRLQEYNYILDLFIYLLIFSERTFGGALAFEGIRLVKERLR